MAILKKKDEVKEDKPKEPLTGIRKLEIFMKYFSYVYVCFCWACTVEYVCFATDTIRMSYFGFIWWYVFLLGLAGACYGGRGHHRGVGWRGLLGTILCTIMFAIMMYGADVERMIRALGMMTKQGLFSIRFIWDIKTVANILFGYFIVGGIILFAYEYFHKAPPKKYEDEEERRRSTYQSRVKWIGFFLVFAIILICSFVPPVHDTLGYIFNLLSTGDINKVIELIRSAGPWAVALSTFLMVFQSLAAPIPAFLITFSNAAVFGWIGGCILSWSSAMLAAAICFWIARFFGRDAVMLFMSRGALASVDRWFTKYGKNAILICRLLPFMSFDYISYAAGITGMKFWEYFLWTGIGQLPATIVYSWFGSALTGNIAQIFSVMIGIFIVAAIVMFLAQVWRNKHKDLMDESNETADSEDTTNREKVEVYSEGMLAQRKKNKQAKGKKEETTDEVSDSASDKVADDVKEDTSAENTSAETDKEEDVKA